MTHAAMVEPSLRRRFLAIVNPISGRRDVGAKVEQIAKGLSAQGTQMIVERTSGPGHAAELARAAPSDLDAVLVVGGDGTVNEVLTGLGGASTPLAILPTGTENLLAKYLRMPSQPAGMVERLLHGDVRDYDVGRVNQRWFHSVIGVGFDAECVQRLSVRRRGHISYLSYVLPILQTFRQHRFPSLRVTVDGTPVFDGRGLAVTGLIPRYAAGLRLLKLADPTDGLLDVVIFQCAGRTRLLRHALRVALRRHVRKRDGGSIWCAPGVTYLQGRFLSITSSAEVAVEVDGDLAGHLPLVASVNAGTARYLVPMERSTVSCPRPC